jgi:hypothetical protein
MKAKIYLYILPILLLANFNSVLAHQDPKLYEGDDPTSLYGKVIGVSFIIILIGLLVLYRRIKKDQ